MENGRRGKRWEQLGCLWQILRIRSGFGFQPVELAFRFVHLASVGAAELFFDISRQRSCSADDLEGCHGHWDARGGQSCCTEPRHLGGTKTFDAASVLGFGAQHRPPPTGAGSVPTSSRDRPKEYVV